MKTVVIDITTEYEKALSEAERLINDGEVVAIPTETVYGLAGNAYSEEAVKRIFEAKGRPQDNPLIVHISEFSEIYDLVKELDALFPAYPVNTFNDEPPVGENLELDVETERFNIMNMAKSYIDQLELNNVTNDELFNALEELYDQFKGTDD